MAREDRQARLVDELPHEGEELAPDRGVEAGDRLVGEQQAGLHHDGAGDHHPLALAAGDLVRVHLEEALGRAQPGTGRGQ